MSTESALSSLVEDRLGGVMLVRLELTALLERLKHEEHALATSLKSILMLRDQERAAFEVQLDTAKNYALQLEARLQNPPAAASASEPTSTSEPAAPALATHLPPPSQVLGKIPLTGAPRPVANSTRAEATTTHPTPHIAWHEPDLTLGRPAGDASAGTGWEAERHVGYAVSDGAAGIGTPDETNCPLQQLSNCAPFHVAAADATHHGSTPSTPANVLDNTHGGAMCVPTVYHTGLQPSKMKTESTCSSLAPRDGSRAPTALAAHQLQQRLARERSHQAASPSQVARGGPPVTTPAIVDAKVSTHGNVDPFDRFEQGGLRGRTHSRAKLIATGQRPETPPNPAVVTADGATFQFRHNAPL